MSERISASVERAARFVAGLFEWAIRQAACGQIHVSAALAESLQRLAGEAGLIDRVLC